MKPWVKREREGAISFVALMRTLAAPATDTTNVEVFRRVAELEFGEVEPMPHEVFVRCVRVARGK